jgi:hypothetical protein
MYDEVLDFIMRIRKNDTPREQPMLADHIARCSSSYGTKLYMMSGENFINRSVGAHSR